MARWPLRLSRCIGANCQRRLLSLHYTWQPVLTRSMPRPHSSGKHASGTTGCTMNMILHRSWGCPLQMRGWSHTFTSSRGDKLLLALAQKRISNLGTRSDACQT